MAVKGKSTRNAKQVATKGKKQVVVEKKEETPVEIEQTEVEVEQQDFDLPSSESEADDSENEEEGEIEFTEDTETATETSTENKAGHSITKASKSETSNSKSKSKSASTKAVIYIGRLPNGFEERELKKYFSQFGEITQLRLSRNKKTGKSKHYAFIEFSNDKVAEIAVETMDNYLLMGHQLKCSVIQPENVNENIFLGANKRFKPVGWSKVALLKSNAPKTAEKWQELQTTFQDKKKAKQEKLKSLGLDYDLNSI